MSYNFSNGRPSGNMPRVGSGNFSTMINYGVPSQTSNSPFIPQMSMDPANNLVDLSQSGLDAMPNTPGAAATPGGGGIMDFLFGQNTKEAPGALGSIVGGASALSSAMLGWGQYNTAKDALATNKQQYQQQYDAQKKMTNSHMEDRQRARVASNAGAYQSVGSYMNQNGVA